jgi:hypothetical protein
VEYQQGTLFGYEIREYLLEKFGRQCAYCGKTNIPLEVEHVIPESRGGTDRISNLTIACRDCNEEKYNLLLYEWAAKLLKQNTERTPYILENIEKVKKQLKKPLQAVAFMNSVRWELVKRLEAIFQNVELSTGAETKMNRIEKKLPKEHYYDALCVGKSGRKNVSIITNYVHIFKAQGRGCRQMVQVAKHGFPLKHQDEEKYTKEGNRKGHRQRKKFFCGFATGDIAKVIVPNGKYKGSYRGRITIRHNGRFWIRDWYSGKKIDSISYRHFTLIQRGDGWNYTKKKIDT